MAQHAPAEHGLTSLSLGCQHDTAHICCYWPISPVHGRSAANPPHTTAGVSRRDRQTDAQPFHKPCSAYNVGSIKNIRTHTTWTGEWPGVSCDILSCRKLRNGAQPVPGPTKITGTSADWGGNSIVPHSTHTETFDSAPESNTFNAYKKRDCNKWVSIG